MQLSIDDFLPRIEGLFETLQKYARGCEQTKDSYIENLFSRNINVPMWLESQCISACSLIKKIVDKDQILFGRYSANDIKTISNEIVFDIYYLDQISTKKLGIDGYVRRDNYLSSMEFFNNSIYIFSEKRKILPCLTNRNFMFSLMPTLIRQSIEIKIKEMLATDKMHGKDMRIHDLLYFVKQNDHFFTLPLPIETLISINSWTNSFIHTGIIPFCWQSLEAIDLLDDLFTIENKHADAVSVEGFNFRSVSVSDEEIIEELKKYIESKNRQRKKR